MSTPEERAKENGVPVIPKIPDHIKKQRESFDPNPVVAVCGECGRDVRQVESYSCQNNHCPLQPKTTC